jgi:hypothetical protein
MMILLSLKRTLANIEKDDYGAIMTLGWQGRVLVEKHPSVAFIIVEILSKGFERLSFPKIKTEIGTIKKFNKSNSPTLSVC